MRRMHAVVYGLVGAAIVAGTVALAQPPEGGPPGGPRSGPPGGPGGERRGPPSPEQFIDRAMTFDADGDGKLDRTELRKFAEEMQAMRMRGGPGGPPGGPDGPRGGGPGRGPGGGPGGERGFGGDGRRGPPPGGDGERPERPRRPE
ncbi:MAG: hypothetical protein ACKOEM_14145 [Planctomycetia bacterium]